MAYRSARGKAFLVIKVGNRQVSVSMIGALPPMKGNAYYSKGLACEVAKAISVADVTGPVKETIKDVQSVEVQNTMSFSFSRENSNNNCANS